MNGRTFIEGSGDALPSDAYDYVIVVIAFAMGDLGGGK